MKAHTRRAVAYVVGRLASNRRSSSVYDYTEARHVNMSGTVTASSVAVYDYDHSCHISGSGTSLYHYGNRAYVSLSVTNMSFSGYDYDTRAHFKGKVSGTSVSLYDYETGSYYNYSV